MARVTRASVAKQASSIASNQQTVPSKTTSDPGTENVTHIASKAKKPMRNKPAKSASKVPQKQGSASHPQPLEDVSTNAKDGEVGRAANIGKKRKLPSVDNVEDGYDELPHNLGRVPKAQKGEGKVERQASEKPSPKKADMKKATVKSEEESLEDIIPATEESGMSTVNLQETKTAKGMNSHALAQSTPKKKVEASSSEPPSSKKSKTPKTPKKPKEPKTNEYGLTPGVSPFPDYPHPTPEECYEVHRVLKEYHPECQGRPKTIPPPSQIVAGCGQVPSILDALIRTLLSAATTNKNSSSAYQGMVARYGIVQKGVGKGSVDYNAVRLASQPDLEAAISSGGLAKAKSKNIKAILDMVYAENQARREAHLASKAHPEAGAAPKGADEETEEQKAAEIALAEEDVLSLDHYYTLPTYDAIFTFVKYPGIGVKTAACTALFCMQRDCFAVDTHVFRLAKWLGWVPPDNKKVGRDTTFSHLEVRIPDELKFDLHQLFIKHGKTCPRCRASTGESSAKWGNGCVIDHLVKRTGPRKEGVSPTKKGAKPSSTGKKSKKRAKDSEDEDEDEDDESLAALDGDEDDID